MAPEKKVEVKVLTGVEGLEKVTAIEDQIEKIKKEKLELSIQTNTARLEEVQSRIDAINSELKEMKGKADVDDSEVKKLESELASLETEKIDLQLDIETAKLDSAKAEIEDLDGTTIDVNVDNISAMEAVDQISQGFDRLKQGASEVGAVMGDVLESAGRMEQTETFLSMNLGADQAKKKLEEIRAVTDKLPGDDVALQNLLSQAALKDASMTTDAFEQMGSSAADYMAAMNNFGKSATETQQDLMNYILAGNTAEIERSPILQAHVDKLKEGNTIQERSKLLQEALNEEGWAGIASQDIYNNKMQQFQDMIERGKMNLGDMFLQGSEGAMDFAMQLDNATGGWVGMAFSVGSFAQPLTDTVFGFGQLATGMKAIKDLGFIKWLKDLELWSKLSAAANWLLDASLWANPVTWVVIAIIALVAILVIAYYKVDWFREMVDNAWASLQQFAGVLVDSVASAINWVSSLFNDFTNQLGLNTDDWGQAVLGFILFIPQLPLQLGIALTNAIAKALGFGDNFVQNMVKAGSDAVNGFVSWITSLPGKLQEEFNSMLEMASNFAMEIANRLTGGGAGMVIGWLTGSGEHSPGYMYDALVGELQAMLNAPAEYLAGLIQYLQTGGSDMADALTQAFIGMNFDDFINSLLYLWNTYQGLSDYIFTVGGLLPENVNLTGNQIIDSILRVIAFIVTLPAQVGMVFTNVLASTLGFGNNFAQRMINGAVNAVNGFINYISRLPGIVMGEFNRVLGLVNNFINTLPSRVWDMGQAIIDALKSSLGIGSPGHMFYMIEGEFQRIDDLTSKTRFDTGSIGKDMVNSFNPNITANGSIATAMNVPGGDTIINVYGDVDSDKRVQQIIDTVRRELSWNNTTAGRTI